MAMGDQGIPSAGREEGQEAPAFLRLGSWVFPRRTSFLPYSADRAPVLSSPLPRALQPHRAFSVACAFLEFILVPLGERELNLAGGGDQRSSAL